MSQNKNNFDGIERENTYHVYKHKNYNSAGFILEAIQQQFNALRPLKC